MARRKPLIDDDYTDIDIMEAVASALNGRYPFAIAIGVPGRTHPDGLTEFAPTIFYSEVEDLKALIGALVSVVPSAEDFADVKRLIQEVSYGDGPGEKDVPDTSG